MIGNAGEYYVCAELCKRNILALITPKNNPLFDIVASDPEGKRSIAIQVKTMGTTNKQGWKLGLDITKKQRNPRLYVVLVNMHNDKPNDYYIYKFDDLSDRINQVYDEYISTPKKDGTPKKDINFRFFDFKYFKRKDRNRLNKWSILGFDI
jgi:hypothetical protein